MAFRSFGAFGVVSRGRIFMMNILRWAPEGFTTWIFEIDQRPAMAKLRENRTYAHGVATKLIEEKRQELKDGTSRRDLLSLLGPSCVALMKPATQCDTQLLSQVKFRPATGMAAER